MKLKANFKSFLFSFLSAQLFLCLVLAEKANQINEDFALRPAHLDAVPIERDGSRNREFRREIILGDVKDENSLHNVDHENESPDQLRRQIRLMFRKADVNEDGRLSEEELQKQIENNTRHHLEEARQESQNAFQIVDENGDGKITWDEYKNYLEKSANRKAVHPRDLALKQKLDAEKEDFELADADQDGLDEVEWLGLRHPEQSVVMLNQMVNDLLEKLDKNGDKKLSADEFSDPTSEEVNTENRQNMAEFREARHADFATLIDKNGDGYADTHELRDYINPSNTQNIIDEVKDIITLVDGNRDGTLTLEELLARVDLLGASGLIHANIRLHEDL